MSEQLNPNPKNLQLVKVGVDLTVPEVNKVWFPEETYVSIANLDSILKKIDARMCKAGYTIIDGKLVKI